MWFLGPSFLGRFPWDPGGDSSRSNIMISMVALYVGQVAARVTADDAENHEWIVVKLTRLPDRENNKLVLLLLHRLSRN